MHCIGRANPGSLRQRLWTLRATPLPIGYIRRRGLRGYMMDRMSIDLTRQRLKPSPLVIWLTLFCLSSLIPGCGGSKNGGGSTPPPVTQAATPTISPNGGAFSASQTLAVGDSTPGAVFHCTTDGSQPTSASPACPSTLTLSASSATVVVKVYVSASGYTDSNMASATFTYLAPPQAATPTISPNGGAFSSNQNLTVGDSTLGATFHCTIDGTQPNLNSPACPSTITLSASSATVVVKVYVSASGYTDSNMASATFTYLAPQSVVWNSSSINVDLNGSLAITAFNLTASTSCPPRSVAFVVVPVTTDTAHAPGSTLSSYSADNTGATYGNILGGNALLEDNTNSYKVTATCGSSVSNTTLTVNDVAPTLTQVSPTTIKHSDPGTTFTLTGTGFSAQSATQNPSQWQGTLAAWYLGTCPTKEPTIDEGVVWLSPLQIQQSVSGGIGVGTFSYYVVTAPTASGTGGGWACLNAFTVTANIIVGTGNGQAHVVVDPTAGSATVVKNGATTQFKVGSGAGSPVAQGDLAFVPNQAAHTIIEIDTDAMSSQTISTGAEYAPVLVAAGPSSVLIAATLNGDASQGAILALRSGYVEKLKDAPYFSDLAISGANMLWTSTPKGSTTSEVHQMALSGGPEMVAQLKQSVDSLKIMADGTLLAYHVGDATALVLDPFTLAERGSVSFSGKLYGFSGDYATLSDGSIGKVAVNADGAGNPVAAFTLVDTEQGNYGSFWVDDTSQAGVAKVYSVDHGEGGTAVPRVRTVTTVPLYGGRN